MNKLLNTKNFLYLISLIVITYTTYFLINYLQFTINYAVTENF